MSNLIILSEKGRRNHYDPPKDVVKKVLSRLDQFTVENIPIRNSSEPPGMFLRRLREWKEMTVEELANELDVGKMFVYRIENGDRQIPPYKKTMIAKMFGVELSELDVSFEV